MHPLDDNICLVELDAGDIERSPIVSKILEMYDESEGRVDNVIRVDNGVRQDNHRENNSNYKYNEKNKYGSDCGW